MAQTKMFQVRVLTNCTGYLSSGVLSWPPLAKSFSELLGTSRSLIPMRASRSFLEPFGAFLEPLTYQVAYHLVSHLISTCLAEWHPNSLNTERHECLQSSTTCRVPPSRTKRGHVARSATAARSAAGAVRRQGAEGDPRASRGPQTKARSD